jgi:hypothetical protein
LDGSLRAIFSKAEVLTADTDNRTQSAAALIKDLEENLMENLYRWTGHFPERTRNLVRHLAARAQLLELTYSPSQRIASAVAFTTLVTALAMNHVHSGSYESV